MHEREDGAVSPWAGRIARCAVASLGLAVSALLGCGGEGGAEDGEEVAEAAQPIEAPVYKGQRIRAVMDTSRCMVPTGSYPFTGMPVALGPCESTGVPAFDFSPPSDATRLAFQFGTPVLIRPSAYPLGDTKNCLTRTGQYVPPVLQPCQNPAPPAQLWIPEGDPNQNWVRFRSMQNQQSCITYWNGRIEMESCIYDDSKFFRPRAWVSGTVQTAVKTAGGEALTILGKYLSDATSITIGSKTCPVTSKGFDWATCITPPGEGLAQPIVVHAGVAPLEVASDPVGIDYLPPSIGSVAATAAVANGSPFTLTINGSNFGLSPTVTVGSTGCAISSASHLQIVCTMSTLTPGQLPVVVKTASGSSNASTLTVATPAPQVSSALPTIFDTSGGALIDIAGAFFGSPGTVTIGGVACPASGWTPTAIRCFVPPGEGTQPIVVTTSLGLKSSPRNVSYRAPMVSSVMPTSILSTGGTLTITGSNFGLAPAVTVGSTPCAITSASHTQIVCALPSLSAGQPSLQVTTKSGASSPVSITVEQVVPTIAQVSANVFSTAGGFKLTVVGKGFDTPGNVTIGGVECPVEPGFWTDGWITCTVPPGEGTQPLVVTTGKGIQSDPADVKYLAPSIISASSTTFTSAGGSLTIVGANFGLSPAVKLGDATCAVSSASHTQIECTVPWMHVGQYALQVTTKSGASSAVPITIDDPAPVVGSFYPISLPTEGGTSLRISGHDFGGLTGTVTIGGVPCTILGSWSSNDIYCTTPPGEGTQPLVITTASGAQSASIDVPYERPTLSFVSGPAADGTLTIKGSSFGFAPTVTVGGEACAIVSSSHTQIVCSAPALPPGDYPLQVFNESGPSRNTIPVTIP